MSATGFNHSQFAELAAAADQQAASIRRDGEAVLSTNARVTTDGLQGNAADSTRVLGEEVNRTSATADQTVQQLKQRSAQFGENMTGSDNRFASAIMG